MNGFTLFSIGRYKTRENISNDWQQASLNVMSNNLLTNVTFNQEVNTNTLLGRGIFYTLIRFNYQNGDRDFSSLSDSTILPFSYVGSQNAEYPYAYDNETITRTLSVYPQAGYVFPLWKGINLNTSIAYSHKDEKLRYTETTTNSEHAVYNRYIASIRFEKNSGLFRMGMGAQLSSNRYSGNIFGGWRDRSQFFFSPQLNMGLVFSPKHRLNLGYAYDISSVELSNLSHLTRGLNYNEVSLSSTLTNPFKKETQLSINYSIFDLFTRTTFYLYTNYIHNNQPKQIITQQGLVSMRGYGDDGSLNSLTSKLYLSKGLSFMPMDVKLTGGYSYSAYSLLIDGIDGKMKTKDATTSLSFTSRFKSSVNAELSANYHYRNYLSTATAVSNSSYGRGLSGKIILVHKNFSGDVTGTYDNIHSRGYSQDVFNLGFSAIYKLKHLHFKLLGDNILHPRSMQWWSVYNTSYYTSSTQYQKIAGYIQAGMSYIF